LQGKIHGRITCVILKGRIAVGDPLGGDCPSEPGHAPGIKNAPAVGGGTSFILLAVEGGFEPPRGS